MATTKFSRFWTLTIIFLVVITIVGGIVAWSRYSPGQPVEISIPQGEEWQGSIYIVGAVNAPGSYLFTARDNLETLIQAAGGTTSSANLSGLRLYIPETGKVERQRIDINRAEVWLLEALPEIGETLAQRIVEYRQQNGWFRNTNDLLEVAGIGTATFNQIKDLITVGD